MNEYTDYVLGVYLLATGVFGGLALWWWRRIRWLQKRLHAEGRSLS
ncbi:MAG: hypothetical protein H7837_02965 [Magnetococcus sp. MYC-9]